MMRLGCKRKYGLRTVMLWLLFFSAEIALQAQEVDKDSTNTGRNGVMIKVISGGPCGSREALVHSTPVVLQNPLLLDLACSCLLTNWNVPKNEDILEP